MSCAHHAHPPPHPAKEPGHFLSLRNGRCSGPLVFRELQQMQWAPSCSWPAWLLFLEGASQHYLRFQIPFQSKAGTTWCFQTPENICGKLKKKKGERSKTSRKEDAKTTISCPRIQLFPNSVLTLLRVLPQAHHRRQKKRAMGCEDRLQELMSNLLPLS